MPANKYALIRYRVIDECLTNRFRPYPTKEDLRRACEDALYGSQNEHISISTIEKDIYAMRYDTVLGYEAPIEFHKGEKGYFYTDEEYTIKKVPMGEEEMEALRFASMTLYQFREMPVFQTFEQLIGKLREHVSLADDEFDKSYMDHMLFDDAHRNQGDRHIPDILRAIREHRRIGFSYSFHDPDKEEKDYLIEPLLLKQFRTSWYVIGTDTAVDRIKTYGLDRIDGLAVLEEHFQAPDFDAKDYFQHTYGISHRTAHPQEVLIKVDRSISGYLLSSPWHPSMERISESPTGDILRMELVINVDLENELMNWLPSIQVLEPVDLKDRIIKRCETAIYRNSETA
ncbi:MAG: WYL domain-containing protein [Flavobacteriales bacterium]|nr:WYL domain-containing protein [Flavobacteriales bacterium]